MGSSSMKTWLLSGGVILAAVLAYYMFFAGAPAVDSTLQAQNNDNILGAQVLNLLNQIRSLKIDAGFFKGKTFQSLNDYTVQIPPQSVGRSNPFAPLPGIRLTLPAH